MAFIESKEKNTKAQLVVETAINESGKVVVLNDQKLFALIPSAVSGISVIPIGVPIANVQAYNFSYSIGKLKDVNFNVPLLQINRVSSDDRGSIDAVAYKGKEIYNLNATNTGFWRGGHTHPYDVQFNLVVGKGRWLTLENGEWKEAVQNPGEKIIINTGVMHCFQALEPTLMTELPAEGVTGEDFKATNDLKMRDILAMLNRSVEKNVSLNQFEGLVRNMV